jgi:DNA-binding transcriptional regulator YiaG
LPPEGDLMSELLDSKDFKQLMAEADELVKRIEGDTIKDLKEEHRLKLEKHAQHLKKLKSTVQEKIEKKGTSKKYYSAEGVHEAFQEITKAMRELAKYLT